MFSQVVAGSQYLDHSFINLPFNLVSRCKSMIEDDRIHEVPLVGINSNFIS